MTHSDFVKSVIDPQALFLDLGINVNQSDESYGRISDPIVKTPKDLDNLAVRDQACNRQFPLFIDSYKVNMEVSHRYWVSDYHVRGFSRAPPHMVGYILGLQLLMDMFPESELADKMI